MTSDRHIAQTEQGETFRSVGDENPYAQSPDDPNPHARSAPSENYTGVRTDGGQLADGFENYFDLETLKNFLDENHPDDLQRNQQAVQNLKTALQTDDPDQIATALTSIFEFSQASAQQWHFKAQAGADSAFSGVIGSDRGEDSEYMRRRNQRYGDIGTSLMLQQQQALISEINEAIYERQKELQRLENEMQRLEEEGLAKSAEMEALKEKSAEVSEEIKEFEAQRAEYQQEYNQINEKLEAARSNLKDGMDQLAEAKADTADKGAKLAEMRQEWDEKGILSDREIDPEIASKIESLKSEQGLKGEGFYTFKDQETGDYYLKSRTWADDQAVGITAESHPDIYSALQKAENEGAPVLDSKNMGDYTTTGENLTTAQVKEEDIQKYVSGLEGDIQTYQESLSQLEGQISSLDEKIADLKLQKEGLDADIETLERQIAQIEADKLVVSEKMTEVKSEIDTLEQYKEFASDPELYQKFQAKVDAGELTGTKQELYEFGKREMEEKDPELLAALDQFYNRETATGFKEISTDANASSSAEHLAAPEPAPFDASAAAKKIMDANDSGFWDASKERFAELSPEKQEAVARELEENYEFDAYRTFEIEPPPGYELSPYESFADGVDAIRTGEDPTNPPPTAAPLSTYTAVASALEKMGFDIRSLGIPASAFAQAPEQVSPLSKDGYTHASSGPVHDPLSPSAMS